VHFHSIRGVGYKFTKKAWIGIWKYYPSKIKRFAFFP
jgi:hypothetical protein